MKLSCLLEEMEYECVQGTLDREITTLVYDSRKILLLSASAEQFVMDMILHRKLRKKEQQCFLLKKM